MEIIVNNNVVLIRKKLLLIMILPSMIILSTAILSTFFSTNIQALSPTIDTTTNPTEANTNSNEGNSVDTTTNPTEANTNSNEGNSVDTTTKQGNISNLSACNDCEDKADISKDNVGVSIAKKIVNIRYNPNQLITTIITRSGFDTPVQNIPISITVTDPQIHKSYSRITDNTGKDYLEVPVNISGPYTAEVKVSDPKYNGPNPLTVTWQAKSK